MKKINKTKRQKIQKKVLMICRLSSRDVIVITDTAVIKKQMEKSASWLTAVSSKAQVNCRCFTVMVHDMRMASVDCSRQKEVISQLMRENRHLQGAIEILHVH